LAAVSLSAPACHAQMSQTWNVKAREIAENNAMLAVTLLGQHQTDKAITALHRAIDADPTDPTATAILGMALAMQESYIGAMHSLTRSYSLRPSFETMLTTGFVYYAQHDYNAAINAWKKVLAGDSDLCQLYGDIAMAKMRKGDFDEARHDFKTLVSWA